MKLSLPDTPLSRYLRINHPYIWRTRVHVYLPVFCLISVYLHWLSYEELLGLPQVTYDYFDYLSSNIGGQRIILTIIGMLWFIQLWRKPLQNAGFYRLSQAFALYFLCIFVADLGPRLYGHNQIMAVSRIPQATITSSADVVKDRTILLKLCSYDEAIKHREEVSAVLIKYGYDPDLKKTNNYFKPDWICNLSGYNKSEDFAEIGFSDFREAFSDFEQLLEAKKYAEHQTSSLEHFRLKSYQTIFSVVIAIVFLIASTERGLSELKRYLSPLIKLIKAPLHLDITGTIGHYLSRNRPTWWAFGLHVALARLVLATIIVCCFYFVLISSNLTYLKLDGYPALLAYSLLYIYWIFHQYHTPQFQTSFRENFVLIFFITLLQIPALAIFSNFIYPNSDLVVSIPMLLLFIPWTIILLLSATLRNLTVLIIISSLPILYMMLKNDLISDNAKLIAFAFSILLLFFIVFASMPKKPTTWRYSLLYFLAFLFPYVLFSILALNNLFFEISAVSSIIVVIGLIAAPTLCIYALLLTKIQNTITYPNN